ncbi:putative peptidoglycan lipid II flippase [Bartonella sp. CDC_skunk]|uniref:murein biosynthesis integral membrane protein MurJ n=1 Tax=unclassified Bartonella TaxID=2645622 RepID=UPI00099A8421|nr:MULTISPECIES: murein biosynthesis integral membrane protein MurJ [unclassified Bartonella]AQX21643.1 putative peptidoglycan lipid II flippase [Bartonella sp. CDC_skunk]AQX26907.1 putative peptidoglycan lipid II flippase [Bartonella sp. Raccoon60]
MNLIKKFITVASGTLTSRCFGFVREMLMAAALGTGPVSDAFNAAFRFPNTFRRFFAEGAFQTAFVPLFSKKITENGSENACKFAEEVFGVLFSLLLLLTIVMELSMPFLVRTLIAPGFAEDATKFNATIRFTAIMFPYLACMSLAAMMGGMLNALQHYFVAAIAPVFLNIILICVLTYAWIYQLDTWHIGLNLSWGVTVSGLVQLALITIALRKSGMKLSFRLPHFSPNVRQLLILAFPAAITGGITQINLLINTNIASSQSGAVSSLVYADRLYQLPLGVVGIAIATVLLPELTKALRNKKHTDSDELQNRAIEFSLFLTFPASVAFLLISNPIISLLFERGQFTSASTNNVAQLVQLYGIGLPAFVLIKVFIPNFFAREDTKTPMIFAGICVFINISLALTLFSCLSARGIVIAEITAGWVNILLLCGTLLKRGYWKYDAQLIKRIASLIIASFFMALTLYYSISFFSAPLSPQASFFLRASSLAGLLIIATSVYFIICLLFGTNYLSFLRKNVKQHL